jgi:hypothetical protein
MRSVCRTRQARRRRIRSRSEGANVRSLHAIDGVTGRRPDVPRRGMVAVCRGFIGVCGGGHQGSGHKGQFGHRISPCCDRSRKSLAPATECGAGSKLVHHVRSPTRARRRLCAPRTLRAAIDFRTMTQPGNIAGPSAVCSPEAPLRRGYRMEASMRNSGRFGLAAIVSAAMACAGLSQAIAQEMRVLAANETTTLPWSAPVGHRQPRAADIPSSTSHRIIDPEDTIVDRKIQGVCRGC